MNIKKDNRKYIYEKSNFLLLMFHFGNINLKPSHYK